MMPGRKYQAGSDYRYGFNGKENDNDVKGEGNQQDYGMRIYDPRLARFLSVDPLVHKYPFYSPYQFSGNDVIRCIDLDGGEPLSKTGDWDRNTTWLKMGSAPLELYDKVTHRAYDVMGVKDPWTGVIWLVADEGQGQNKWFYLKNDDGSTDKLKYYVENGRNVLYKAHFEQFKTRNEIDAEQGAAIADGMGIAVFMAAATIAATEAGLGISSAYNTKKLIDESEGVSGSKSDQTQLPSNSNNPYSRLTKEQRQQSKERFQKLIKEHKGKLEKMREDPIGMTKPEKLKEMMKDNPTKEVLMQRVKRQEKEVIDQIHKQEGELKKVEEVL